VSRTAGPSEAFYNRLRSYLNICRMLGTEVAEVGFI
jgi:hypothetical protein